MSGSETWTREVLTELRASRFTPVAWIHFFARSFARARERRAARRSEHRTVVALAAAGSALWLFAAVGGRPWLALAGASWWALQTLMVDWHLGMLERPDGSRLDGLGPANLLTIVRGGLPPALLVLAGSPTALTLLLLGGAADVADGWLARRRNETTLLGLWLDGSADTLVVGAAALGATLHGLLPLWATVAVLVRLALPWAVGVGAYFGRGERPRIDDVSAARSWSLAAGAVVYAGISLGFLGVAGAAIVASAGAMAGAGVFATRVRVALAAA